MRVETGRTEWDEGTFNPNLWMVTLYDETEDSDCQGEEVIEFAGDGEKVHKFDIYSGAQFSAKEQREICEKAIKILRAMYGDDFEPKFPHQV